MTQAIKVGTKVRVLKLAWHLLRNDDEVKYPKQNVNNGSTKKQTTREMTGSNKCPVQQYVRPLDVDVYSLMF
jgi:hypothetical protein